MDVTFALDASGLVHDYRRHDSAAAEAYITTNNQNFARPADYFFVVVLLPCIARSSRVKEREV